MCPHVTATNLVLQGVPTLQLIFGVRKLACALIPGSLLPGRASRPCIPPHSRGGTKGEAKGLCQYPANPDIFAVLSCVLT